jgi:hypothetical protein
LSIFIKMFMVFYIVLIFKKMAMHEEDRIYHHNSKNDDIDNTAIIFGNLTSQTIFHSIEKQNIDQFIEKRNVSLRLFSDPEELSKYISISYGRHSIDWYKDRENRDKVEVFPAKFCESSDFMADKTSQKYFEDWAAS